MRGIVLSLLLAIPLAIGGCQTSGNGTQFYIFAKRALTTDEFKADLQGCGAYVTEQAASGTEQTSVTVAGIFLGGIVGGIAAHSAYEKSKDRLNDECMYRLGYRTISLPERIAGRYEIGDEFLDRSATADLADKGELDQAIIWSKVVYSGDKEKAIEYLEMFPDGLFVPEATRFAELE